MPNTRTRTTIALSMLITLITMSALAPTVKAQANCAVYAKLALQQHKENLLNKCGFVGPEWNDQYARHMNWCNTVGPDQWKNELKKRDKMLAACKKK